MRHFELIRNLWKYYWSSTDSVRNTLDTLTCSTWVLPFESLQKWINSNQRRSVLPQYRKQFWYNLLNLLLGLAWVRHLLYTVLYKYFPSVDRRQPRLPYYLGDVYQLLTDKSFYLNISSASAALYCWIVVTRFQLTKRARWYRLLLYIEAIIQLEVRLSRSQYKLLRHVSSHHYRRYRNKCLRALHFESTCCKSNHVFIVFYFVAVLYPVVSHPEWGHPILATIVIDLLLQLWYYFWFRILLSVQIIFYLNSAFFTMLLCSVHHRLGRQSIRKPNLSMLRTVRFFDHTLSLLCDVNRFWRGPLCDFYLLLIPALMTAIYVLFFVQIDPLFACVLIYAVFTFLLSMHFNNWVAARVRITGTRICRTIHHRGIFTTPTLTLRTKAKIINMMRIISAKPCYCKFGIQIGTIGIANQKVTLIIIIVMTRVLMFLMKIGRVIQY